MAVEVDLADVEGPVRAAGQPIFEYLNMMKKILYGAHSNVAMGLGWRVAAAYHAKLVAVDLAIAINVKEFEEEDYKCGKTSS